MNYYNEIDPYCAHWLYNLIQEKLIPPGHIDTRPIQDVRPRDLAPYTQCHFFAGIAGWPLALRLANISPGFKIWTGSCPCQPFSAAGNRRGFADERHLWPHWFHLISVCRPPIVVGEQVARAGIWLDTVLSDLEAEGYACGSAVLPAAGVGAPHKRDRFWFVAHAGSPELWQQPRRRGRTNGSDSSLSGKHGPNGTVADAFSLRELQSQGREPDERGWLGDCSPPDVADASRDRRQQRRAESIVTRETRWTSGNSWWAVEPDVGRVAHGIPARVAKLRALGNAIVPQVAAEFLTAAHSALGSRHVLSP